MLDAPRMPITNASARVDDAALPQWLVALARQFDRDGIAFRMAATSAASAAVRHWELAIARRCVALAEQRCLAAGFRRLQPRRGVHHPGRIDLLARADDGQWVSLVLHVDAPSPRPLRGDTLVPAHGGLCVAFLGCDGSGKSTVTRDLGAWLATHLHVEHVYLGSGQGTSSWLRWPLLVVHRLLTRWRPRPVASTPQSIDCPDPAPRRSALRDRLRPIWALVLAAEKRQKLRRLFAARAAGTVLICDRWPQDEIHGFNDGPLLTAWSEHRWRLCRALAAWERVPYRTAAQRPPDLLIKLRVSAEVALHRKPDMSAAEVARRIAAVDALRCGGAPTITVDADQPLASVLEAVHRAVWEAM